MTRRTLIMLAVAVLLPAILLASLTLTAPPPVLPRVTIVTTRTPFSAAVVLAQERGWFRDAGVEVTLIDRTSGKAALAELIDGNGDYATASETPIMFALLKSQPVRVLCALSTGIDTLSLVARRDRGITSSEQLPGKRIGFSLGTNSQYFLDTFLEYRGIKPDAVLRVPVRPDAMVEALVDGSVDAISVWAPYNQQAMTSLGANAQELRVGSVYRWSWYLTARNETVARSRASECVLKALLRATEVLRNDPASCAAELADQLGQTPDQLIAVWSRTLFDVNLDQSLLLSLEMQARWALGSGFSEQKEVPNFLPAISAQPLRVVDRDLVTIIDSETRP